MILCVANWSEGRNEAVLGDMRWTLRTHAVQVHFDGADPDHNRLVTAFSGHPFDVRAALFALCRIAFDAIDMRKHTGVHPRIGALDVCPFIRLDDEPTESDAIAYVADIASNIAWKYQLPAFLYERSETGKHANDLPSLRKGQFEGLIGRKLEPDFGTKSANPWLGATVFGLRNWLIAANINLATDELPLAKSIARKIRDLRDSDARFAGVRALGLPLPSRGIAQVSMNLTMPDATPFDPIYDFVAELAPIRGTELIGVIRKRDAAGAARLNPAPEQVI